MKHWISLIAPALVTAVPGLSAQGPRPSAAEIARTVDSASARVIALGISPAFGVAVVMDGKTILARGYGYADATKRIPADANSLWYLASTSKSYTGFGTALLAHQKAVDLEAPITALLPQARWPTGVDASKLTLNRFLSHTHFLNDNAVVMSAAFTGAVPETRWPELIRLATPMAREDMVYSNFGYNVAAMVIDRTRPEGWKRFLDSAVYRPAGLSQTFARVSGLDPRRIVNPHALNSTEGFTTLRFEKTDATMNSAGGHVATLGDLARWTIVQMEGGRIDGMQVYPAEAVALSHKLIARHTVESSKRFGPFVRDGWGAGWDLGSYEGEPMVSRFGGYASIRSHLSMLPARHIGVVAQANGPGASGATDIIAALAYDLEAGRPNAREKALQRLTELADRLPAARAQVAASDSARRARQKPLAHPVADFAGRFEADGLGTLEFAVQGGALSFRWGVLEGPVEVFDAERNQLRFEFGGNTAQATFAFEASGPARSVTFAGMTFTRR
jgi:CubicO group peptidase (beta-lactamase class C family)